MKTLQTNYIQTSDCAEIGFANSLDFVNGTLYLAKITNYASYSWDKMELGISSGGHCNTQITPGQVYLQNTGCTNDTGLPVYTNARSIMDGAGVIFTMPASAQGEEDQTCSVGVGEIAISSTGFTKTKITDHEISFTYGSETIGTTLNDEFLFIHDALLNTNGLSAQNGAYIDKGQVSVYNNTGNFSYLGPDGVKIGRTALGVAQPDETFDVTNDNYVYITPDSVRLAPPGGKGGVTIATGSITVAEEAAANPQLHNVYIASDGITITDGIGTVYIPVPKDEQNRAMSADWTKITFCVDGASKEAWVLMTVPQAVGT